MTYTLEQIENAYCVLFIEKTTGEIWINTNTGALFAQYYIGDANDEIALVGHMAYQDIQPHTNMAFYTIFDVVLLDYENFMRHFGMYFLKF